MEHVGIKLGRKQGSSKATKNWDGGKKKWWNRGWEKGGLKEVRGKNGKGAEKFQTRQL